MSRHLVRLERAGMVVRRKEGRTNAWRLTAQGEEAARSLRDVDDRPRCAYLLSEKESGRWTMSNEGTSR